jgi:hypothetical protein
MDVRMFPWWYIFINQHRVVTRMTAICASYFLNNCTLKVVRVRAGLFSSFYVNLGTSLGSTPAILISCTMDWDSVKFVDNQQHFYESIVCRFLLLVV